MSRGAALSISREMGVEFADHGAHVNALCSGPVNVDRAGVERTAAAAAKLFG